MGTMAVISDDLTGRRALVTGSGQGVGAAIAAALAAAGANVAVNDISVERAEAQATAIRDAGGSAFALPFDVTNFAQVTDAMAEHGPFEILVNNAGNAGVGSWPGMLPFAQTSPDDWTAFLNVNLYGVMHCVRAALPGMIEAGWGRVVTIISDAGRVGEPNMAAYAAAKAGAAGLTRERLSPRRIGRVTIRRARPCCGTTPFAAPACPKTSLRWCRTLPRPARHG
jgi:2-hydroxycyclohexanecarboxyl-CoA dehydrogenase